MKLNNTIKRSLEILDLLSKNQNGLTLGEITSRLNYPKTSIFDILTTLKHYDYVEINDDRLKSYTIGVKAFTIGNSYIQNTDIIKISKEILKHLGDKLGRTIFIATENQYKIIYLYKYEPSNAIVTTSNIGTLNEIYLTSLGKAIFAYRDDIEELLSTIEFNARTPYTIRTREEFIEALHQVKERGYSIDNRESEDYLSCIGAPIFDHNGNVSFAISASGIYTESMDINYISSQVIQAANEISKKLGYHGKELK